MTKPTGNDPSQDIKITGPNPSKKQEGAKEDKEPVSEAENAPRVLIDPKNLHKAPPEQQNNDADSGIFDMSTIVSSSDVEEDPLPGPPNNQTAEDLKLGDSDEELKIGDSDDDFDVEQEPEITPDKDPNAFQLAKPEHNLEGEPIKADNNFTNHSQMRMDLDPDATPLNTSQGGVSKLSESTLNAIRSAAADIAPLEENMNLTSILDAIKHGDHEAGDLLMALLVKVSSGNNSKFRSETKQGFMFKDDNDKAIKKPLISLTKVEEELLSSRFSSAQERGQLLSEFSHFVRQNISFDKQARQFKRAAGFKEDLDRSSSIYLSPAHTDQIVAMMNQRLKAEQNSFGLIYYVVENHKNKLSKDVLKGIVDKFEAEMSAKGRVSLRKSDLASLNGRLWRRRAMQWAATPQGIATIAGTGLAGAGGIGYLAYTNSGLENTIEIVESEKDSIAAEKALKEASLKKTERLNKLSSDFKTPFRVRLGIKNNPFVYGDGLEPDPEFEKNLAKAINDFYAEFLPKHESIARELKAKRLGIDLNDAKELELVDDLGEFDLSQKPESFIVGNFIKQPKLNEDLIHGIFNHSKAEDILSEFFSGTQLDRQLILLEDYGIDGLRGALKETKLSNQETEDLIASVINQDLIDKEALKKTLIQAGVTPDKVDQEMESIHKQIKANFNFNGFQALMYPITIKNPDTNQTETKYIIDTNSAKQVLQAQNLENLQANINDELIEKLARYAIESISHYIQSQDIDTYPNKYMTAVTTVKNDLYQNMVPSSIPRYLSETIKPRTNGFSSLVTSNAKPEEIEKYALIKTGSSDDNKAAIRTSDALQELVEKVRVKYREIVEEEYVVPALDRQNNSGSNRHDDF